ncbi:MAG: acyloxyacyl hydrolase [Phycisphaerales bacterium]|nr:acyloxyacyl hydrolase [Phycisphaerales bacterium]
MKKVIFAAVVVASGGAATALGQGVEPLSAAATTGLTLDVSASLLAMVQQPETAAPPAAAASTGVPFGDFKKGQPYVWYLSVGAGFAADGDPGTHSDAFVAASTFIGEWLEVQLEGSGWYFDQEPDSTFGGGIAVNLRWHFWHGAYGGGEGHDWTAYIDAGIGMIFSGDDVPSGGTSVNFAPRAGVGFTARLGDTETRLVGGVRWHHMSNARTDGDSNNPDVNAPMFYLGLQWPL